MQMYPPTAGAPQYHYAQTGTPVYQQAGIPPYNQAFPQAGVPPYSQAFPGVSPYNQAIPGQNQGAVNNIQWSTGLCGCFQDPGNCCLTCWCPCVTVGQIAEVVDKGTTSCTLSAVIYTVLSCVGLPCIYSCGFRTKLRNLYSLKESCCGDCCLHCWCECCAICQEYRELKNRGVDPSIGWQGNVHKWNRAGSAMPPPVAAGMYR